MSDLCICGVVDCPVHALRPTDEDLYTTLSQYGGYAFFDPVDTYRSFGPYETQQEAENAQIQRLEQLFGELLLDPTL